MTWSPHLPRAYLLCDWSPHQLQPKLSIMNISRTYTCPSPPASPPLPGQLWLQCVHNIVSQCGVYVCMYVRMYPCMYVCMYVCMYLFMSVCMHVFMYVFMYHQCCDCAYMFFHDKPNACRSLFPFSPVTLVSMASSVTTSLQTR